MVGRSISPSHHPQPLLDRGGEAAAFRLLNQLQSDAYQVRASADFLAAYERDGLWADWQAEGDALLAMQSEINGMDGILSRIQTMQGALSPDESAEIAKITPAVFELTRTARTAIKYLTNNEDCLPLPWLSTYASELYSEAARVERLSAVTPAQQSLPNAKSVQPEGPGIPEI